MRSTTSARRSRTQQGSRFSQNGTNMTFASSRRHVLRAATPKLASCSSHLSVVPSRVIPTIIARRCLQSSEFRGHASRLTKTLTQVHCVYVSAHCWQRSMNIEAGIIHFLHLLLLLLPPQHLLPLLHHLQRHKLWHPLPVVDCAITEAGNSTTLPRGCPRVHTCYLLLISALSTLSCGARASMLLATMRSSYR